MALSANDQVKVAFAVTDGTINNLVRLYVAGQGGATLPSSVLASLTLFFAHYSMLTDSVLVSQPAQRTINLGGATIVVKSAQLASAQAAIQRAFQIYLGGVDPVQALSVNGRIDHAYLVSLIRATPGVVKFDDTDLTINGAATDLQLPVTPGAYEVASWTEQVASVLSWATTA
jgi:hypothetical protein